MRLIITKKLLYTYHFPSDCGKNLCYYNNDAVTSLLSIVHGTSFRRMITFNGFKWMKG